MYLLQALLRFLKADDRPEARRTTLGCLLVVLIMVVAAVAIVWMRPVWAGDLPEDPEDLPAYRDRCIGGSFAFDQLDHEERKRP